ncbi:MAG: hypothetical protein HZB43_11640 [candidate division Zixibacteria bacterium]|nr:hypothetical protein [candidate division Zixibacteria bacterium]
MISRAKWIGQAGRTLSWNRLAAIALATLALAGCAGPPRPLDEPARRSILSRLQDRKRLITSAVYRVRWQAKGTEPHGEFFLEIAYKAPDLFRVSATGPFGIPAFTGVMVGEKFWFVDHKDGKLTQDDLWNLEKYDMPLSSFFAEYWRDLFAGGWGGTETVIDLQPTDDHNVFHAATDHAQWLLRWDGGRRPLPSHRRRASLENPETGLQHRYPRSPLRTTPPPAWEDQVITSRLVIFSGAAWFLPSVHCLRSRAQACCGNSPTRGGQDLSAAWLGGR